MSSFKIVRLTGIGLINQFVDEMNKLLEAQEGYKTNLSRILSILQKDGTVWVVLNKDNELIGLAQCDKQHNFSGPVTFIQIYVSTDVKNYAEVYKTFLEKLLKEASRKAPKSKHVRSCIVSDSPTKKKQRIRSRILRALGFTGSKTFYSKIECE